MPNTYLIPLQLPAYVDVFNPFTMNIANFILRVKNIPFQSCPLTLNFLISNKKRVKESYVQVHKFFCVGGKATLLFMIRVGASLILNHQHYLFDHKIRKLGNGVLHQ